MKNPFKLLIVDDSKLMRRILNRVFEKTEDITVVGEAGNGIEALKLVPVLNPDVILMDINMPVMDGLTALKHIMIKSPVPTVMCSTLTKEGAAVTFDALKYGAVDFIHKPSKLHDTNLKTQQENIIKKVIQAAQMEIEAIKLIKKSNVKPVAARDKLKCEYVFAVGSSAGEYATLLKIIPHLRSDIPVAFITVIYAEPGFVNAFVRYLNFYSSIKVKKVINGLPVKGGVCYITAGTEPVSLNSDNGKIYLQVNPVKDYTDNSSIDFLMSSVAKTMKNRSCGMILSGTGHDGTKGLTEIIKAGGASVVQSPQNCMCREMPESAIDKCKIQLIVSDTKIPEKINAAFTKSRR